MRLADGSLADYLKTGRLPLAEVARILEQVASALDYAHDQQVIHRDLKPANILLDEQQNCLLADFGIAHLTDGSTSFSPEGRVVGTPLYMSPEQISGRTVSAQSDLYSLGVIAFELVCGQPPFQGATIGVLARHSMPTPLSRTIYAPICPRLSVKHSLKRLRRSHPLVTIQVKYSPKLSEPPLEICLPLHRSAPPLEQRHSKPRLSLSAHPKSKVPPRNAPKAIRSKTNSDRWNRSTGCIGVERRRIGSAQPTGHRGRSTL